MHSPAHDGSRHALARRAGVSTSSVRSVALSRRTGFQARGERGGRGAARRWGVPRCPSLCTGRSRRTPQRARRVEWADDVPDHSDAWERRWPRSASAPGAWAAGAARTTRPRGPRCAARWNSAATSSTPRAPTGTATARTLIRRGARRLVRSGAVHRHEDRRRRTASGRRGPTTRSTRSSPPTTSARRPSRAWPRWASRASTCSSSTSGPTRGPATSAGSGPSPTSSPKGSSRPSASA